MSNAQRDTEKIVACNAFSRLTGKTQVAMFPSNDHVTDRLTHSLKVTMAARFMALREYMFSNVYLPLNHPEPAYAARAVVETLYVHYSTHPGDIPWSHPDASLHQADLDYVAGMTDRFALATAER